MLGRRLHAGLEVGLRAEGPARLQRAGRGARVTGQKRGGGGLGGPRREPGL